LACRKICHVGDDGDDDNDNQFAQGKGQCQFLASI